MNVSEFKSRLRSKIYRTLKRPTFSAVPAARSASDSGFYPEIVRRAVNSTRRFNEFKRDAVYRQILEHVSEDQGALYLDRIRQLWPELLNRIEEFKINDLIGNPYVYSYPGIGFISPTTLRYMNVCCDLREIFGGLDGMNIAEVGVGYGGQFLIADQIWNLGIWSMFDLDPVLALSSRYLESNTVKSCYFPTTLNRFDARGAAFDLVISNYAFSELPIPLQLKYIEKVLSKSKRGYLTMNSGKSGKDTRWMNATELKTHFPNMTILEELPLRNPDCYIIVWGDKKAVPDSLPT